MLQRLTPAVLMGSALFLGTLFATDRTLHFIPIDYPNAFFTLAEGINPGGDVVGMYSDHSNVVHGFVLRRGIFTTVDYPGSAYTELRGITPGGDLVGNYAMPGENPGFKLSPGGAPINIHGFVLKRDGTLIRLAYPGHPNMITSRIASDGSVLGCFHDHDFGFWMRGFLWKDNVYTGLDGTYFGLNVPSSMNNGASPDLGTIVGFSMDMTLNRNRAYVIRNGNLVSFDYPGASVVSTRAWDINPSGAIVGDYRDASGTHGFLLEDGAFTSLTFPGARVTQARGINPAGSIAGWHGDATGFHGFVAIPLPADAH